MDVTGDSQLHVQTLNNMARWTREERSLDKAIGNWFQFTTNELPIDARRRLNKFVNFALVQNLLRPFFSCWLCRRGFFWSGDSIR